MLERVRRDEETLTWLLGASSEVDGLGVLDIFHTITYHTIPYNTIHEVLSVLLRGAIVGGCESPHHMSHVTTCTSVR